MSNTVEHRLKSPPLTWSLTAHETCTLAEFRITASDGLLNPADLSLIDVPKEAPMKKGIVFSGRGPVWLFGYLVHQAHPFAWAGIFDPRLQAAVAVESHVPRAPRAGDLIPLPKEP